MRVTRLRLCVFLRSVRWRRRCLSLYVLCLFSPCARVPFSLDPGASSLREYYANARIGPERRQCTARSLLRLVVGRRKLSTRRWWSEHNAPAGGFSTSIAQSSGRTGRRDLAPHPHEKPSLVLSSLVSFSRSRRQKKIKRRAFSRDTRQLRSTKSARSCSRIIEYTCEFAFQVPADVRTVVS